MNTDQIPRIMAETKYFLEVLKSKKKMEEKKVLGLSHKQFRELIENGINTLVVQARDKMIMAAFIQSKGLIDEMTAYHNEIMDELRKEIKQ